MLTTGSSDLCGAGKWGDVPVVCDVGVTEAPPQAPRRVETPIARDRPFAADHHNANGGPAVAKLRTDGIRGMLMAPERGCDDAMVARHAAADCQ